MRLLESVPNFSEGRDEEVLQKLRACFEGDGIKLLDFTADPDHNRSVATVAGEPVAVADAVLRAVGTAARNIDLRKHDGQHPFVGATDVVPFVPIVGMTEEEADELARQTAQGIAVSYNIPTYLYEHSATRPQCKNLADIRKGGFDLLRERMTTLDFLPDYGPLRPHPTAGVTVVGVRPFLVAYNVNLTTDDVCTAKAIARRIRERDGGLPCVKALGVTALGSAQVTMNLTDYRVTPPAVVFARVQELAAEYGTSVRDAELIGLLPRAAIEGVTCASLGLPSLDGKVLEDLLPPF